MSGTAMGFSQKGPSPGEILIAGIVFGLMIALLWRIGQNNNVEKTAVLHGVEFNQQKGKQE